MRKKYNFKSKIIRGDVVNLLKKIPKNIKFDIIIADPPYNIGKNFGNNKDNMSLKEYISWSKMDFWMFKSFVKRRTYLYLWFS